MISCVWKSKKTEIRVVEVKIFAFVMENISEESWKNKTVIHSRHSHSWSCIFVILVRVWSSFYKIHSYIDGINTNLFDISIIHVKTSNHFFLHFWIRSKFYCGTEFGESKHRKNGAKDFDYLIIIFKFFPLLSLRHSIFRTHIISTSVP